MQKKDIRSKKTLTKFWNDNKKYLFIFGSKIVFFMLIILFVILNEKKKIQI